MKSITRRRFIGLCVSATLAFGLAGCDSRRRKRQNHRVAKQENSWRRLESSRSFLVFARNAPRVFRAAAAIP